MKTTLIPHDIPRRLPRPMIRRPGTLVAVRCSETTASARKTTAVLRPIPQHLPRPVTRASVTPVPVGWRIRHLIRRMFDGFRLNLTGGKDRPINVKC